MNEILFKNRTNLSKQNYMKLLEFHQKRNNWKYWTYTIFFSIVFLSYSVLLIINHSFLTAFLVFVICILFIGYRLFYPYYKVKKEISKEEVKNNMENCFIFYDKYFKLVNEVENTKLKYHKIYRVYENKNYFYLYLDKEEVLIMQKDGFEIGTAIKFRNFIKDKVKFKYKRTY